MKLNSETHCAGSDNSRQNNTVYTNYRNCCYCATSTCRSNGVGDRSDSTGSEAAGGTAWAPAMPWAPALPTEGNRVVGTATVAATVADIVAPEAAAAADGGSESEDVGEGDAPDPSKRCSS